jgi:DNA-binding MarR family transcriptional regulator
MDHVDRILSQWKQVRPDLDVAPMETIGRINRLSFLLRHEMEKTWKLHGLNAARFDMLAALRRSDSTQGLSPSDLMIATMVTSGTMTHRIDQLAKAGLVERVENPQDGRGFLIRLTQTGFNMFDKAIEDHVETQLQLVSALSLDQRQALNNLLAMFMNPFEETKAD